jgi:hypothetical protein
MDRAIDERQFALQDHGEDTYPSSVKLERGNEGRLLETTPGRAVICFVTFRKQHKIPGFKPHLTEEGYERCAKIKVRKMIIDAELEERQHRVHQVSARSARESEQGENSKGMRVPGKVRGNSL